MTGYRGGLKSVLFCLGLIESASPLSDPLETGYEKALIGLPIGVMDDQVLDGLGRDAINPAQPCGQKSLLNINIGTERSIT